MAYLLALGSAALYGAADFFGGLASRRTNTLAIVVASQGVGLVLLALMLPLLPQATPSAGDLIWSGAAGLAGGIGVTLLYRALAVGRMAVVAPTTAVCAVMIPVVTDILRGERLGPLTILGIALAVVAIVLVSRQGAAASESGPARFRRVSGSRSRPAWRSAFSFWRWPKRTPRPVCGRSSRRASSR